MSTPAPAGRPAPVRITGAGADWETLSLPGSQPAIRRTLLHREGRGGASVQGVAFPPGWSRQAAGHFRVAEEFVVLRGWLRLSGVEVGAGDHAVVPAGALRVDSSVSPDGCLAVAWFGGVPHWEPGPAQDDPRPITRHLVDAVLLTEGGRLRPCPPGAIAGPADVVTTGGRWEWIPDGTTAPPPEMPAVVRLW